MNEIIKEMGHIYAGNDPITDERKIHKYRKNLK